MKMKTVVEVQVAIMVLCGSTAICAESPLNVSISIQNGKDHFSFGDLILLNTSIQNNDSLPKKVLKYIFPNSIEVKLLEGENYFPAQKTSFAKSSGFFGGVNDDVVIKSNSVFDAEVICVNRYFDFSKSGRYSITETYVPDLKAGGLKSNTIFVEVSDPTIETPLKNTPEASPKERSSENKAELKTMRNGLVVTLVSPAGVPISLGSSPLRVEFINKSAANWRLTQPNISEGNIFHLRAKGVSNPTTKHTPNAIFQAVIRKGNMKRIYLGPEQPKISILPTESRAFPLDIYTFGYDWHPGEYEMWIENEQEKINSNLITFKLEVTLDSIGLLLDMAGIVPDSKDVLENHHQEVRRDFAINWLIKAFPDLPLNPITDRDAQNVVDAKNIQNRRFLDDFRAKWESRKNAPETLELIKKLNAPKAEAVPGTR